MTDTIIDEARALRLPENALQYCDTATVDHKHSLAKGGQSTYENCVLACFICNSNKGAMSAESFRQHMQTPKGINRRKKAEARMIKYLTSHGIAPIKDAQFNPAP